MRVFEYRVYTRDVTPTLRDSHGSRAAGVELDRNGGELTEARFNRTGKQETIHLTIVYLN